MDNINKLDRNECTGCLACLNMCPKKCISIYTDELGFQYPVIDEGKCIHCGLCSNTCPALNKTKRDNLNQDEIYAVINKDYITWKRSSSGGAFAAICEEYCKNNPNTTIYGASYNKEDISVQHIGVEFKDINKIQKSKYVQSNISNIYNEIENKLKNGEHVIFSGTPCQNYALKNYLRIKNISLDKTLFIDLICHGVGSPRTFKESILDILKRNNINKNDVANVNNRGKRVKLFETDAYNTEIITDKEIKHISKYNDLHLNLFLQKLNCRDSCENCQFASENRNSDITIADFKNFYCEFPKFFNKKNASTMIIHTNKGKSIFNNMNNIKKYESNIDVIKRNNPIYFNSIKCSNQEKRNKFIAEIKSESTSSACIKCMQKYANMPSTKEKIKSIVPEPFRQKIKILLNKWRNK